jgi:hypothetical protein
LRQIFGPARQARGLCLLSLRGLGSGAIDPLYLRLGIGLALGLAHRSGAGYDASCPVALGWYSGDIRKTFPVSFRITVDRGLHECACTHAAGLAIAAARHVTPISPAGQLAVAASACVRTRLDRVLYCGFRRVVRHAQVVAKTGAGADCEILA